MPQRSDFPQHAVDQRFDLAWKVTRDAGLVRADGIVERPTMSEVGTVILQLVGLDATGRLVSFSTPTAVRWGSPWDVERFTIELTPRGGEDRFNVRVQSLRYRERRSGR